MLLKERLISLLIFVAILFIILILIATCKKKKRIKSILNLYVCLLTIMGYYYSPLKGKSGGIHGGADLNRIWFYLDNYSHTSIKNMLSSAVESYTPGANLYYSLIQVLGNKHLLPAITALITFSFCFGIIKSIVKQNNKIYSTDIAISLFLFMSRGLFLQTISNIRTLLGLSIIAWCIYQEFYNKKRLMRLLPYYILGASFHPFVQVIALYRFGYFFLEKNFSKIKKILLGIIVAIGIHSFGIKYLSKILMKAEAYFYSFKNGTGYFYVWEFLLSIASLSIIIYLIYTFKKQYKAQNSKKIVDKNSIATNKLIKYITPLLLLDIACSFLEFSSFQRISWYLNILCIPLTIYTIREKRLVNGNIPALKITLIITSLFLLLVSCARGDLCGLNFFEK